MAEAKAKSMKIKLKQTANLAHRFMISIIYGDAYLAIALIDLLKGRNRGKHMEQKRVQSVKM